MKNLSLLHRTLAVGLITSVVLSTAHALPQKDAKHVSSRSKWSRTRKALSMSALSLQLTKAGKQNEELKEGATYELPLALDKANIRAESSLGGINQVRFVLKGKEGIYRHTERYRPYELLGDTGSPGYRPFNFQESTYTVTATAHDRSGKLLARGTKTFTFKKGAPPRPTVTPTRAPSRTPTAASTRTPSNTPIAVRTPTRTPAPTRTPQPSPTPVRTPTVVPTRTPTTVPTPPIGRSCSITGLNLPRPVDTTRPTSVVGNGTPGSCTEAAFAAAIAQGGVITFNCGPNPTTITLTSEKTVTRDTTIDGGGRVTLSGGQRTRILSIKYFYDHSDPVLNVQNLTFLDGRTTDAPNTHSTETGGAAIYRLGGTLNVFNSRFINNKGPVTGQDVAGGAIYSIGGGTTTIVDSYFEGNECSNGGAIGNLGNSLNVINTTVRDNRATGTGGNPGNGGNGAGICIDGAGTTVNICNTEVLDNRGNAYGGGIFRVSYSGEPTNIENSVFQGNELSGGLGGGVYLQGTRITMNDSVITGNRAPIFPNFFQGPGATLNGSNNRIDQ